MQQLKHQLDLLPNFLQKELTIAAGNTDGLSDQNLIARYKMTAETLIAAKRLGYKPSKSDSAFDKMPAMSKSDVEQMATFKPAARLENHPYWQSARRGMTYVVLKYLNEFCKGLAGIEASLIKEAEIQRAAEIARQRAVEMETLRLKQEAARQLLQRQVEEAARVAAELAARQLAKQQVEAAAAELAQRKMDEAALQEARAALEVVVAQPPESAGNTAAADATENVAAPRQAEHVVVVPGPAAMAEINHATLELKRSIESSVRQYSLVIRPYLEIQDASVRVT